MFWRTVENKRIVHKNSLRGNLLFSFFFSMFKVLVNFGLMMNIFQQFVRALKSLREDPWLQIVNQLENCLPD